MSRGMASASMRPLPVACRTALASISLSLGSGI
jgi:hypothetical protein